MSAHAEALDAGPSAPAPALATRRIALDAASRRWTLIAAAACLLPLLLQLPATTALGLGVVGVAVAALSWRRPMPAWSAGLLALALLGLVLAANRFTVGRDTGCALLAAMLVIKPAELRSLRDARSLIGFALFAPFATFLLDQGPWSLLLGLCAATLALAALLRLSDLQSGGALPASSLWRRCAAVGRLMLIGLPLAMAAFWLFPRIGSPLWGVQERAQGRPGLSDRMSPGEWLDFMGDDTPVLRVKFSGATPAPSQMYWRGPVLTRFDGRTWTRSGWPRGERLPAVVRGGQVWDYSFELESTDLRQMVALELPLAAPDGTRLDADYELSAARPLGTLTRWRMRSAAPTTFEPALSPQLRRMTLQLPQDFNPRSIALARAWRRDAGADDAAIVNRALRWIRRDFAYTLETPLLGRDGVDEFLFEQKAGFCQHFSSAFVVLMRAAGIPSRIVTGYVGGYHNRYGDYWLVRRSDAHAWAEVWLAGRGWVRVDPTAAVAPENIYDTLADRAPGTFGGFAGFAPVWDVGDWMRRGWNDLVLGFDADRQQRLLRPFGVERLDDRGLIALFAAIGGAAMLWMLWLTARSDREGDPLLRAWHRLDRRYRRLGLGRAPHETGGDWLARVEAARPGSTALAVLSARFADWRYAPHEWRASTLRLLVHDLRRHRP